MSDNDDDLHFKKKTYSSGLLIPTVICYKLPIVYLFQVFSINSIYKAANISKSRMLDDRQRLEAQNYTPEKIGCILFSLQVVD